MDSWLLFDTWTSNIFLVIIRYVFVIMLLLIIYSQNGVIFKFQYILCEKAHHCWFATGFETGGDIRPHGEGCCAAVNLPH